MSDDTKTGAPGSAPAAQSADLIKNLKSEFDRKISNIEAANKKLLDQVGAMLRPAAPAPATPTKIDDVWFDNPEKAADTIESRILSKIDARDQAAAKTNSTIATLTKEFPELMDEGSDLTVKAVEIFNTYTAEEKRSAVAYKAAVREAAMELGIAPSSKRKSDDSEDSFSLSGSGSSNSRSEGRASRKDSVDPRTVEFAKLMGVAIDKPEVKERLKSHQKRSWKNYGK